MSGGASAALWIQVLLKHQGCSVKGVLREDSRSAAAVVRAGRGSERTRHVSTKYYVKQCVDSGELALEYCPTASVVADALAKPLQGYQLECVRDYLLGYRGVPELPKESLRGGACQSRYVLWLVQELLSKRELSGSNVVCGDYQACKLTSYGSCR